MALKERIDVNKFFTTLVVGFLAIQVVAWILAQYFGIPMLKMGWAFLLMIIIIGLISIFVLGRKIGQLRKEDLIFIGLEFIILIVLFYFLPSLVPGIFSALPHI